MAKNLEVLKRKIELKYFFWAFFYLHLALYIATNILLITSNYLLNPNQLWFIIPLVSWGVWVFAHFFITFFLNADSSRQWRESQLKRAYAVEKHLGAAEQEARQKASTQLFFWMLLYFHLAVFIGCNTIMIFINILLTPDNSWSLIPLAGWGLGLLFHFLLTFLCLADQVRSWREKQIKILSFGEKDSFATRRDAFLRFFFWNLFYLHLALYILCNLMLFQINVHLNKQLLWFIWPLASWGIFVLFHFALTYVTSSQMMVRWREEQMHKLAETD